MRLATLKKLIKTTFNIIAIETKDTNTILDIFREHSSSSKQPVYVWKEDFGLYRQNMSHIKIPNTTQPQQLINFINKDNHDSLFVLTDFTKILSNPFIENALLNIAKDQAQEKHIFILGNDITLSDKFKHIALETKKMFTMKLKRAA